MLMLGDKERDSERRWNEVDTVLLLEVVLVLLFGVTNELDL